MRHLEDADRREQERAVQLLGEDLDAAIPFSDVLQYPGTIRQRSKAARFASIVLSRPAPPAT